MNHTHELVVDEIAKGIVHIHPELPQLHGTELTDKVFHTTHHTKRGPAAHDGPASVLNINWCLEAGWCAKTCLESK